MQPECLTDKDIAAMLGRSVSSWEKKRKELQADGFPKKHPILKMYLRRDVEAYFENCRFQPENKLSSGDHSTEEPHLGEV